MVYKCPDAFGRDADRKRRHATPMQLKRITEAGLKKGMLTTDINCDMGEGIGNDAQLMPFISSANIACGFHAGNADTMQQTVQLAIHHHVAVGAHPSYDDVANFGRMAMELPASEVYDIVCSQIKTLAAVCCSNNTLLHHVKPHGALYNTAAKDLPTAQAIARAVKDCGPGLILYGLPGTYMQQAAAEAGIAFWGEAFADRSYQPDGTLTPRQQPGALISNTAAAVQQALHKQKQLPPSPARSSRWMLPLSAYMAMECMPWNLCKPFIAHSALPV